MPSSIVAVVIPDPPKASLPTVTTVFGIVIESRLVVP